MKQDVNTRGGSRTAAASKMEGFVTIVNGWKPLTIITRRTILDVAAALDPPLSTSLNQKQPSNLIEIALRYGCSPVNLLHTFRALFSKNTFEVLLLYVQVSKNICGSFPR